MDYVKLHQLLTLSETLRGYPYLASIKRLVDHEIREMDDEAVKAGAELDAKLKAEREKAAEAEPEAEREVEANDKARRHQEGTPIPVRNTYEGVPGPAEPQLDVPAPPIKPKAIPSGRTPWVDNPNIEPGIAPTFPDPSNLPNVDRRL